MTIGDIEIKDFFDSEFLSKLRAAFADFDTSGDGLIGKDELCGLFSRLGKSITKKQADIILREVDADGNGEIDFEELCYLEIVMSGAKPRADLIDYTTFLYDDVVKQLQQWFTLNDMGEEGFITVEAAARIAEEEGKPFEAIREVLPQVAVDGKISFPDFCSFWAVISGVPKKLNYREYLSYAEVAQCRKIFQDAAAGKKSITKKEVQEVLKEHNFVRVRRHLKRILEEVTQENTLDFRTFCNVIVKLSRRRKLWEVSPESCSCGQLWSDGFTVQELLMCGFGLEHFKDVKIPARKLYQEGAFSALDLRHAGYSASDLRRAGMGLLELRSCGFSMAELRTAGFSAQGLQEANRKMHGSFRVGDFTLLPQIAKGINFSKSQELFSLQRLTMTPLIREHNDGRPPRLSPLCQAFAQSLPNFKHR